MKFPVTVKFPLMFKGILKKLLYDSNIVTFGNSAELMNVCNTLKNFKKHQPCKQKGVCTCGLELRVNSAYDVTITQGEMFGFDPINHYEAGL